MSAIDDEERVKRRGHLENIELRRRARDISIVLSSVEGRRFYWRLLCECGVFTSSYTGNNTTFFNEGRRQIGLMLLNELNDIAPDAYLVMLKESKQMEATNG